MLVVIREVSTAGYSVLVSVHSFSDAEVLFLCPKGLLMYKESLGRPPNISYFLSTGPEKEDNIKPGDANKFKGSIYMVFEYMDHDLTGLSDRPGMRFSIPQIKVFPFFIVFLRLNYCYWVISPLVQEGCCSDTVRV